MKQALVALLLVIGALPSFASRRRAATPGCVFGIIDAAAWVRWIAVDDAMIYYYDEIDQAVYRAPKGGGPRVPLLVSETVFDIALDSQSLYVAAGDSIRVVSKDGASVRALVAAVANPYELAVDATHVYWVSASDGRIERVRKDGSGRQLLVAGLDAPTNLLVDGGAVFFAERGAGVRRITMATGAMATLSDGAASEMAVAGGDIVYLHAAGISRVAKSGGAPQRIVDDPFIFAGPRVAEGFVYYATTLDDFSDAIMRVPLAGGTPQLVRVLNMAENDFAIDDCGMYIGTFDRGLIGFAP